jgi:Pro-kumamolisin, activation domain/Subtilase family
VSAAAPTPSAPDAIWSKLPRYRFLLLFAGALAVFFVIALVVILIVKPGATTPPCPTDKPCGRPPTFPAPQAATAKPLVSGGVWKSNALGFSFSYNTNVWKVANEGPRGVLLKWGIPQRPDLNLLLLIQGTPLSENPPAQLLQKQIAALKGDILGLRSDPSPKHALLGPAIGYVTGNAVGGPYSGTIDTPQGPGPPIALLSMAATDGRISLVATALTTSPEQIKLALMGQADSVLNTLHWPSGAEALGTTTLAAAPAHRTKRTQLAAGTRDRYLGPMKPSKTIGFTLVLRFRQGALDRYLQQVQDPASPNYQRYLTARQIGERFGIGPAELARIRKSLEAAGLHVTEAYPQRTSIRASGTVARVSAFFRTTLGEFRERSGRVYHRPLRTPAVPSALRRSVVGVTGLSNRSLALPAAVPDGALAPKTVAKTYNIAPLHRRGIRGQGQTIAIISFDSFNDSDPKLFDKQFGITGPRIKHRKVGGGTQVGEGSVEVNLDIDVIRGIAPKAQIIDYEGPNGGVGYADMLNAVIADGKADIASISWGNCDDLSNLSPVQRTDTLQTFRAAVARGISIFVASGDAGAYTCQRRFLNDHRLTVEFPSSTPYVISVGGTLLTTTADGTYFREYGWEDPLANAGGGGGLNPQDARPDWQKAPGVNNSFSNGKRQLPDVSAASDPDSGFFVVSGGRLTSIGGTSAATPFWAASMLLIKQYVQKTGSARRLGFVAPILYRLASTRQPYPPFHDVVAGGNRYFRAAPGWDYVTGLGSPNVWNLARDMARHLKRQ